MAAPIHHDPSIEHVLLMHETFDPPEGSKSEVIGGNIVVSPSPPGRHNLIHSRLHRLLDSALPTGLLVTDTVTLDLTATGERYVPDLLVIQEEALDSDEWLFPAKDAELVVEIVSPSNAAQDRVVKVRGYAASGVPVYLLVDPLERTVTLFTEPADGSYRAVHRVPFGDPLPLPAPFTGTLDTAVFA